MISSSTTRDAIAQVLLVSILALSCFLAPVEAQEAKRDASTMVEKVFTSQASNGDRFELILSLDAAKQLLAAKTWTEDDYDNFLDWRAARRKVERAEREVRIAQKEKEEVVLLLGYIDTFLQLHAVRGKKGFDESVYAPMRNRIARLDLAQPHFTEELRAKVREAKRIADIQ